MFLEKKLKNKGDNWKLFLRKQNFKAKFPITNENILNFGRILNVFIIGEHGVN